MKTQSNDPIQPIQAIGEGKYYVHTNIIQKTREAGPDNPEPTQYWEADTVLVADLTYDSIVVAIIRTMYTVSQEIGLINNYIVADMLPSSPEGIEYAVYQECRTTAKVLAKAVLGL